MSVLNICIICHEIKEINVLLKILTYTNVVGLTMLAGVCMNYFPQNSKYLLKNSMEFGRPNFFLQCYENFYVYKIKQHIFNLLVSKNSPKCNSEHLLFSLKIDLLVFTKRSFDFCFVFRNFICLGLISAWTHWRYLHVYYTYIWYLYTHTHLPVGCGHCGGRDVL